MNPTASAIAARNRRTRSSCRCSTIDMRASPLPPSRGGVSGCSGTRESSLTTVPGFVTRLGHGSRELTAARRVVLHGLAQLAHHAVTGGAQIAHYPGGRTDYFGHPFEAENYQ